MNYLGYAITKEDGLWIIEAFDLACGSLNAAQSYIERHLDRVSPLRGRNLI